MTKIQESLLQLFKYTCEFLQRNNIKYIACAGTVLGAVRHKGFIPWDDDIDLYLFREDYNKLLKLKSCLQTEGYDVVSLETDKGYYLPFAKVIDRSTTIWELKQLPFLIGNYIDIFPLDTYTIDDKTMANHQKRINYEFTSYQGLISDETVSDAINYLRHKRFGCLNRYFHSLVGKTKDKEKELKKFLDLCEKYNDPSGEKCVSLFMYPGKVFKTEWFLNTIEVPFEDTSIIIPANYDDYLTEVYGDWRTPPPAAERNPKHEDIRYYVNMKEGLSMEQVKARIISGEKIVD